MSLGSNKVEKKKFTFPDGQQLIEGEVKRTISGEFTVQKFISGYQLASRTSVINHLIEKNNYKSYLEIGVRDCRNFEKINLVRKVGVDPNPIKNNENIIIKDSDSFFISNKKTFDLIFIDGLHLEKQVDLDIRNSLKCLNDLGTIVMHDCNPPTEFHQREEYEVDGKLPPWNGTTWRSYAKLRMKEQNLSMYCIDCDWGVGIVKKGKQNLFKNNNKLSYLTLHENRKILLNLISVKDFIESF